MPTGLRITVDCVGFFHMIKLAALEIQNPLMGVLCCNAQGYGIKTGLPAAESMIPLGIFYIPYSGQLVADGGLYHLNSFPQLVAQNGFEIGASGGFRSILCGFSVREIDLDEGFLFHGFGSFGLSTCDRK
jgi:hypothetical protein